MANISRGAAIVGVATGDAALGLGGEGEGVAPAGGDSCGRPADVLVCAALGTPPAAERDGARPARRHALDFKVVNPLGTTRSSREGSGARPAPLEAARAYAAAAPGRPSCIARPGPYRARIAHPAPVCAARPRGARTGPPN